MDVFRMPQMFKRTVEQTPKAYMEELDAQVDLDRKVLEKKLFDRNDEDHRGGGTTRRMQSTTDPESGQQSREGKPDGFHYSEHRTVDSKRNVIVNVHIEPANINDVTPIPEILDEIQTRLGKLPKYMGLDAGYHSAWIAHLLEQKGIQGVIGYRRHTHKTPTYGKYRFKYPCQESCDTNHSSQAGTRGNPYLHFGRAESLYRSAAG